MIYRAQPRSHGLLRAIVLLSLILTLAGAARAQEEATSPPVQRGVATISTNLGPICFVPAGAFNRSGIRLQPGGGVLGSSLVLENINRAASYDFEVPESMEYLVLIAHSGLGPTLLTCSGRPYRLPTTGASVERGMLPVTSSFLAGPGNVFTVQGVGGGRFQGLILSAPLAQLRKMALERSKAVASAYLVSSALEKEATRLNAEGKSAEAARMTNALDRIRGSALRPLSDWAQDYLDLYDYYASLRPGMRSASKESQISFLSDRLRQASSIVDDIHNQLVPEVELDPAEYRLPSGPVGRESFNSYPWLTLKIPYINDSETNLGLLGLLGVDAFSVEETVWPAPRILKNLSENQFRCVLKMEEPIVQSRRASGALTEIRLTERIPNFWDPNYESFYEHLIRRKVEPYTGEEGLLGVSYWPDPSLQQVGRKSPSGLPVSSTDGVAAWSEFRSNWNRQSRTREPVNANYPVMDAPEQTKDKLAQLAFATETINKHFRAFNKVVASTAPRLPRIGLFTSSRLGPAGFTVESGVDASGLLLNTGYPAIGISTEGETVRLAYAAGLARMDPAQRPWWESSYEIPKQAPNDPSRAYIRMRRDFWRMAFWGLPSIELDGGPRCENLFYGDPTAGLLRQDLLRLLTLHRHLMSLGKVLRTSHIKHQGVALLEPGLPLENSRDRNIARSWEQWMLKRRFAPLWIPRVELQKTNTKGLFDGFRILLSPGTPVLSNEHARELVDWIRKGGVLVTTDPVGFLTPEGRVGAPILASLDIGRMDGVPGDWRLPDNAFFSDDTQILSTDSRSEPTIFLTPVGEGHALVAMKNAASDERLFRLLNKTVDFVFPYPDLRADVAPDDLELFLRENDQGERLLLVLNANLERSVTARLNVLGEYKRIQDLTAFGPRFIRSTLDEGVTRLKVSLDPGQGHLLNLGQNQSKLSRRQVWEKHRSEESSEPEAIPEAMEETTEQVEKEEMEPAVPPAGEIEEEGATEAVPAEETPTEDEAAPPEAPRKEQELDITLPDISR